MPAGTKTIGTFVILQPFDVAKGITMKRRDYRVFFSLFTIYFYK